MITQISHATIRNYRLFMIIKLQLTAFNIYIISVMITQISYATIRNPQLSSIYDRQPADHL